MNREQESCQVQRKLGMSTREWSKQANYSIRMLFLFFLTKCFLLENLDTQTSVSLTDWSVNQHIVLIFWKQAEKGFKSKQIYYKITNNQWNVHMCLTEIRFLLEKKNHPSFWGESRISFTWQKRSLSLLSIDLTCLRDSYYPKNLCNPLWGFLYSKSSIRVCLASKTLHLWRVKVK